MVHRGKLERIPAGFQLLAPLDARSFWKTPLISPAGKLRALMEPLLPARPREDESLASFVRRRFAPRHEADAARARASLEHARMH